MKFYGFLLKITQHPLATQAPYTIRICVCPLIIHTILVTVKTLLTRVGVPQPSIVVVVVCRQSVSSMETIKTNYGFNNNGKLCKWQIFILQLFAKHKASQCKGIFRIPCIRNSNSNNDKYKIIITTKTGVTSYYSI